MGQPAVERLREFLRELNPEARALLIAELERSILRGDEASGSELILAELRRSLRGNGIKFKRVGDPIRLFYQPLEQFLVDDAPDHKHRGRIARASLEPIWMWLSGAVMPGESSAYAGAVERALLANDSEKAKQLADAFQEQAAQRMQAVLDAAKNDKARRQLDMQLGAPRAVDDVRAVIGVIAARRDLSQLNTQLPGHLKALVGPQLENVKSQLDVVLATKPDVLVYALVLVMNRMAAGWQLIRLATKAAGSDETARIAETPYGIAVTIVMAEVERMIRELAADLKSGRGIAVSAMLKEVHDAVRGLRTELDIAGDAALGRQLAAMRAEISKFLSAEVELVPGRVRRLLRPPPPKDIVPGSTIDAGEVDELEKLVGLIVACRNYASELAVNEVTQRTFSELQQFLDTGARTLLDGLRGAGETDRAFRRSQVEAAVRLCGQAFGREYATLLSKAAEVAAQDHERKAARG